MRSDHKIRQINSSTGAAPKIRYGITSCSSGIIHALLKVCTKSKPKPRITPIKNTPENTTFRFYVFLYKRYKHGTPRNKKVDVRKRTSNKSSESGRSPSPTPPVLRPLSPHCSGFSAKKVRTSSKNCRNFAQNSESAENGERIAECGGRGGIPP